MDTTTGRSDALPFAGTGILWGVRDRGGYSDRSKLEVSEGGVIVEPTAAELEQFEQVLYSLTYGGAR